MLRGDTIPAAKITVTISAAEFSLEAWIQLHHRGHLTATPGVFFYACVLEPRINSKEPDSDVNAKGSLL